MKLALKHPSLLSELIQLAACGTRRVLPSVTIKDSVFLLTGSSLAVMNEILDTSSAM